jgi:putative endopeptidase
MRASLTLVLLGACAGVALSGCDRAAQPGKPAAVASAPQAHGLDLAGLDRSARPGDDFFRYANGGWVATVEIPAARGSLSNFSVLAEKANKRTSDLIQDLAKTTAPAGSDAQKIGDYYASYLDEAAIERNGTAPLKPDLDRIAAIADRQALSRALGAQVRADVDPLNNTNFYTPHLFGLWVAPDFNRPDRNAPYLLQGGLGMPDRDYYLDGSARMADFRSQYEAHVARTFELAGTPAADAKARAARVMALEKKIAQRHWSAVDSREVTKANNPWARSDFARRAPGMDWPAFFDAASLAGQNDFIVWQPSAFTGLSQLVASEPIEAWRDYLAFHVIEDAAAVLPKAFVDESFAFNQKALSGVPENRERWKRAVDSTNTALGWAVGKLYVERYFPADAKAKAQAMVTNIIAAYRDRLNQVAWMSPQTRAKALEKLNTLWVGVGYPDKWRDYSALQVVRGDAFGNWRRAQEFEYRRNLAKLGGAVDRQEWSMTPQTVNAVNLPIQNGLNFPAAILDAPFFDPAAPSAVNYGAIGSVIGHEISHSFDNQGAQFDAQGRLRMWWTPADFAHFTASSDRLVKQYDAYAPFPDLHLNGRLTVGENIADVAGLAAAFDAWKMSLGGKPAPTAAGGLTGEQAYFLGYAQAHRAKYREEALRRQVATNEHAPGPWRAATVRNIDGWYPAFNVQPGQALYLRPADRVKIW